MRAFVTGGTGLLGNNLARLLVEQGHPVKALARSKEKAERLFADLDITIVCGDLLDIAGFAPQMEGCDVLFHTAAYLREYFSEPHRDHAKMFEAVNIQGTIQLLTEAEKRGIKQVIYASSAGVIGLKPDGSPGDESTPPDAYAMKNLYHRSKILAEEAVQAFLKEHALPVVLILPGWIFGPGDAAPSSSGRVVLDFLAQKLPGILDGGSRVVDVRDVAQAMIAAVERGKSGERYIVGGNYVSLEQIMKTLEAVSGVPAPKRHIPYGLSLVVAWFKESQARRANQPVLISVEGVRTLHEKRKASSEKAKRELEVTFRPLVETLRDEVAWYRARGYV